MDKTYRAAPNTGMTDLSHMRDPNQAQPLSPSIERPPFGRSEPDVPLHDGGLHASMLARLAHELRTPLSAITAAAELMRDERFGPIGDLRYRGYAGDIHENARHALAVIERMLDHGGLAQHGAAVAAGSGQDCASSEAAPFELVFCEVDIAELVERLASSVRALVETARLDFTLDVEPKLPRLVIDAVTVRQMLLNLIQNAVRATPPDGVIGVTARWTPPGPLVIAVTDTGRGMDPALVAGLLNGDAVGTGHRTFDGGAGIGFPLVMRLATANGAQISIDSQPGNGTRVAIAFPSSRIVV